MKKVGILYNPSKEVAQEKAQMLLRLLEAKGLRVWLLETKRAHPEWQLDAKDRDSDLVVVLGGDGTFLRAARMVSLLDIPVLGINYGHLGFLSEYGDLDLSELASSIKEKKFTIQKRTMLEAFSPGFSKTIVALNDISINRSPISNLLYTDIYIDDELLHSFRSDGVVISTPTGSTAYALSAGGAVMDPNIKAFQIVPIAAHSLNSRPHVISDDQTIVLQSKDRVAFTMQADGQELVNLDPGAKIIIKKAIHSLKLAQLNRNERSFYHILREKMKWGAVDN